VTVGRNRASQVVWVIGVSACLQVAAAAAAAAAAVALVSRSVQRVLPPAACLLGAIVHPPPISPLLPVVSDHFLLILLLYSFTLCARSFAACIPIVAGTVISLVLTPCTYYHPYSFSPALFRHHQHRHWSQWAPQAAVDGADGSLSPSIFLQLQARCPPPFSLTASRGLFSCMMDFITKKLFLHADHKINILLCHLSSNFPCGVFSAAASGCVAGEREASSLAVSRFTLHMTFVIQLSPTARAPESPQLRVRMSLSLVQRISLPLAGASKAAAVTAGDVFLGFSASLESRFSCSDALYAVKAAIASVVLLPVALALEIVPHVCHAPIIHYF
jgi:hypothetical protein